MDLVVANQIANRGRGHEDLERDHAAGPVGARQQRLADNPFEHQRQLGPDLSLLVRDALVLQESGQPGVHFVRDLPEGPVSMELDATMIGQALTNLIKNAGEAIESLIEKGAPEG